MPLRRMHQQRNREAGSILVLTLFYLMVVAFLAVAFWNLIPVELHAANRQKMDTQAYFAADAGVSEAVSFLRTRTEAGNIDAFFIGGAHTLQGELDDMEWRTTIFPGPETRGFPGVTSPNPLRLYRIEGLAFRTKPDSTEQTFRRVTTWVRQETFGQFGWNPNNADSGNVLWINLESFRLNGNYHTNAELSLYNNFNVNWDGPASFAGAVTFSTLSDHPSSLDRISYNVWGQNRLPFNLSTGEAIPGRYRRIASGGRTAIQWAAEKPLPRSSDAVGAGAWGDPDGNTDLLPPNSVEQPIETAFFGQAPASDIPLNVPRVNARFNNPSATGPAEPGTEVLYGLYIEGDVEQVQYDVVDTLGNTIPMRRPGFPDPVPGNQQVVITQIDNRSEVSHLPQADRLNGIRVTYVTEEFQIPANSILYENTPGPNPPDPLPSNRILQATEANEGFVVVEKLRRVGSEFQSMDPPRFELYNRQGNNLVYSTGDIDGVRGTVTGRRTLATRTDEGTSRTFDSEIQINGELLYHGTARGEQPRSARDQLGLISYAVRMKSQEHGSRDQIQAQNPNNFPNFRPNPRDNGMWPWRRDKSETNPYLLYTSIFAGRDGDPVPNVLGSTAAQEQGGGFGVDGSDSSQGAKDLGIGMMHIYGSVTEGFRQRKGTINTSGIQYQFNYDENLRTVQPPYFPSLPTYEILTWEEESFYSY